MRPASQKAMTARRGAERRGRLAETLAVLLLRLKGYRILERRFRCRAGEVDILASRGDLVIGVEVKARSSRDAALQGVTAGQRRRIERAVSAYCARTGPPSTGQPSAIRFDVVAVGRLGVPRHHIDAWRPYMG